MSNSDDILDATLDDLADLPGFAVFPIGAHRCKLFLAVKAINGKTAVEATLKLIAHEELANPEDPGVLKEGDETTILMILKNNDGTKNEISEGQLKIILSTLKEAGITGDTNREVIDQTKNGIEIIAVTGHRKNKQTDAMQTTLVKFEVVG